MIANAIRRDIATAEVVIVTDVDAGRGSTGYVTVRPLVGQVDSFGNIVPPVEQFKVPYMRVQGGVAALIVDPVINDIGIAIYMKRDSSNITVGQTESTIPGSFRMFDQSDGFYIGGFLNQSPSIFLELDQNNNAVLTAPQSVTVNTQSCTVNADDLTVTATNITENCTNYNLNASGIVQFGANVINLQGNSAVNILTTAFGVSPIIGGDIGESVLTGNLRVRGNIDVIDNGEVTVKGIPYTTHTHGGVQTGSGSTSAPNG